MVGTSSCGLRFIVGLVSRCIHRGYFWCAVACDVEPPQHVDPSSKMPSYVGHTLTLSMIYIYLHIYIYIYIYIYV